MKPIFRGAISFGLVNIPIRLYSAAQDKEIKFKFLHKKDLARIRYIRICSAEGIEVPWEEIVKGYEMGEDHYVVFTDKDFEKANPKKVKTIEISDFADESEIDSIYFTTPYYLEPEKGASKAYSLLCTALKKSGKVGIGTFVLRNHEHLGIIKSYGDLLILIQLRFQENIRSPKELHIPKESKHVKREVDMAVQYIKKLSKKFNPKDYTDTYTKEIKVLIKKKGKGVKVKTKSTAPSKSSPSKVEDIMSLLEESLKKGKTRKKKKSRKTA